MTERAQVEVGMPLDVELDLLGEAMLTHAGHMRLLWSAALEAPDRISQVRALRDFVEYAERHQVVALSRRLDELIPLGRERRAALMEASSPDG